MTEQENADVVVDNVDEMYSLHPGLRRIDMRVYVIKSDKTYALRGGLDNKCWWTPKKAT